MPAQVLLNRSRQPQRISVKLQQLVESSGLESWGLAFGSRTVTRVSVRDVWEHAEVGRVAVSPPAKMLSRNLAGEVELVGEVGAWVGAHAAFMGVVTLCIADEIFPALLPGLPDEEHRVWGE